MIHAIYFILWHENPAYIRDLAEILVKHPANKEEAGLLVMELTSHGRLSSYIEEDLYNRVGEDLMVNLIVESSHSGVR